MNKHLLLSTALSRVGDNGFCAITQRFDDKFTHVDPTFIGSASEHAGFRR
jgi:hypothetical protein